MKIRYLVFIKFGLTISIFLSMILNLQAQIINGNFETDSNIADLSGWSNTCGGPISVQDAAPGGGIWCAQSNSGNTQSCFPGYTYQVISSINNGEIWKIVGWAKVDSLVTPWGSIGIYFALKDSLNNITLLSGDTTSSENWTFLTVEDTIFLSSGDSVLVVLDAGMTGGPANGLAYFDLISAENTGVINGVFTLNESIGIRISTFPNPFSISTTIEFKNKVNETYTLSLYNPQGQLIRSINDIKTGQIVIERKNLTSGLYIFQLHANEQLQGSGKLIIE